MNKIMYVKAKDVNTWAYGVAIREDGTCKLYQEDALPIPVKEDTICRPTEGVDDKDDIIYENDLIEYKMPYFHQHYIAKVKYSEEYMKWIVEVINSEQKCYWDLAFIVKEAELLLVKGNVFD